MSSCHKNKILLGCLFLVLIIIMNLFYAASYYNLSKRKIPQFFVWQTNVEKPKR